MNTHATTSSQLTSAERRPLCILVAEDNAVNQTLAVRLLQKLGHTATVAANGREALAAVEAQRFDVVLMDLQMPEMDGFAATAAIRQRERAHGGRQIIVALTAHALTGTREECFAAQMDGYLAKPLRAEDLARELDRVTVSSHLAAPLEPPLDVATALRQASDDPELLGELAGLFVGDAPARMEALRSAMFAADAKAVERAAHTLKGSLTIFAAERSAAMAREIEARARDGRLDDSVALLEALGHELDLVVAFLRTTPWIPRAAARPAPGATS